MNYLYHAVVSIMPIMISAYDAGYYNLFNLSQVAEYLTAKNIVNYAATKR